MTGLFCSRIPGISRVDKFACRLQEWLADDFHSDAHMDAMRIDDYHAAVKRKIIFQEMQWRSRLGIVP